MKAAKQMTEIIDLLVDNYDDPWIDQFRKGMPPHQFRLQFLTAHLSLPRGSGHSTAAFYCWEKYNAIIIHPSHEIRRHFFEQTVANATYRVPRPQPNYETRCFTVRDVEDTHRLNYDLAQIEQNIKRDLDDMPELLVVDGYSHILRSSPGTSEMLMKMIDIMWSVFPFKGQVIFQ